MVKRLPTLRETRIGSLGQEDPLEKKMATHSSTLVWKTPWTEEPGRLQSMGSQRVGHDWVTSLHFTNKNEKKNAIYYNIGGSRDYHIKRSKWDNEINITWYHLSVKFKIWYKWIYLWKRNRLTDFENELLLPGWEEWQGGIYCESGTDMYTLLYFK